MKFIFYINWEPTLKLRSERSIADGARVTGEKGESLKSEKRFNELSIRKVLCAFKIQE